jgi:hypothetical protein
MQKFFRFLLKNRSLSGCLPLCSGVCRKICWKICWKRQKSRFTEKRKNPRNHCGFKDFSGAAGQIRTADLVITNDALYRLSYSSMLVSQTARLL